MKLHPARLYVALAALVLVIAACTCSNLTSSGSGSGTVLVQNNSTVDVCTVYISPADDDSWNSDWLNTNETIAPGASREFSNVAADVDVLVEDCSENALLEDYGVTVNQDQTTTLTVTD